jgi:hypothetical protein
MRFAASLHRIGPGKSGQASPTCLPGCRENFLNSMAGTKP